MNKDCANCGGLGVITVPNDDGSTYTIICPACDGTGQIDDDGE